METRDRVVLWAAAGVLLAGIIAYSQTLAFAWDEGFHLLAAQLITRGKRPYIDFLFPQTPLYTYWNATLMRVFGESWRMVHVVSSLAVAGAALLTAEFVLTRAEDRSWRLAASLCALLLVGLNSTVLWYGTIGQPYAMCLLLVVAAFRLTVLGAERDSTILTALAGLCAGAAAASSLLTAPFAPVLLIWTWLHVDARWKRSGAFVGAAAIPFTPLALLFAQGPRQVLFGVFQYHALYRSADWPDAGKQNLDVITAWMNNYEAVLLIGLAGLGLMHIAGKIDWSERMRQEFYLCGWLTAAESAYLCIPRPTFGRYYLFVVPFLAILSAVGLYAIAARIGSLRAPWRYPLVLGLILATAFVKYSADAITDYSWKDLEKTAAKVDEVTAPQAPLYADEHVYFLTRRMPPPGMEYMDSHKLTLPDATAELMHVVPIPKLDQEVAEGRFATISICNNQDRIDALGLPGTYAQTAEVSDCKVFWDRR